MLRVSILVSILLAISSWAICPAALADQLYGLRSFDAENEKAKAYVNSGAPELALPIFERGAELGDIRAINNLAGLYRNGQSVPKDTAKAISLYEKASEGGLPHADYNLGWIYFGTDSAYLDLPKSRAYWQKAVEADFGPAFSLLAQHYDGRSELPRDPERVKGLLERGSAIGDKESTYALAHFLLSEPAPLGDPQRARTLLPPLSRSGYVPAMLLRGDIARLGLAGNKISYVTALGDYQQAEEAGSTIATAKIETMAPLWYRRNVDLLRTGIRANEIEAMAGLTVQCDYTDYLPACHKVAYVDYTGQTQRGRDLSNAVKYLRKTCDLGEMSACIPYADAVVAWGPSSDRADITRAAQLLSDVCNETPPNYAACYNLAYMEYYTAFGVGSYDSMKRHVTEACFNGGYKPACPMAYEVFNSEARSRRASAPKPRGAIDGLLTMFVDNFMDTDRAAGQAGQQAIYNKYSSPSASRSSTPSYSSSTSAQDSRDFDNFINSVNAIGTGYNSSCPSSNPYC